uniref:Uncharacterized protein n=1 Tax=Paraburkholderia sprentiae WSM5005 TaxID=754502 RepID=A0A1I9YD85_9BURK
MHRLGSPFSHRWPEKCAHLTAHPSIFRESKPGLKPGGRSVWLFASIAFKSATIGLHAAFSPLRQIDLQIVRPARRATLAPILRYSRCHADRLGMDIGARSCSIVRRARILRGMIGWRGGLPAP